MEREIQESDGKELVFEYRHPRIWSGTGTAGARPEVGYAIHSHGNLWLFGPEFEGPIQFPRGMLNIGDRLIKAGRFLADGRTLRAASENSGVSQKTALKLRRVLEIIKGVAFTCGCGRSAHHIGWCNFRRSVDPDRLSGWFARKEERSDSAFQEWMNNRLFVRPVEGEVSKIRFNYSAYEALPRNRWPAGTKIKVTSRVLAERDFRDIQIERNAIEALPRAGEPPVGIAKMWHRCADPKPSFGVFRDLVRERMASGELIRDPSNRSNKAGFMRPTTDER